MNDQMTLEGDTVSVQITEKVTTTVLYKADYFKASLSDEKIDKVKEYVVIGEDGKADRLKLTGEYRIMCWEKLSGRILEG